MLSSCRLRCVPQMRVPSKQISTACLLPELSCFFASAVGLPTSAGKGRSQKISIAQVETRRGDAKKRGGEVGHEAGQGRQCGERLWEGQGREHRCRSEAASGWKRKQAAKRAEQIESRANEMGRCTADARGGVLAPRRPQACTAAVVCLACRQQAPPRVSARCLAGAPCFLGGRSTLERDRSRRGAPSLEEDGCPSLEGDSQSEACPSLEEDS